MSRATSTGLRAAVYGPETDEVFLLLLKIEEASLSEPIRAVHNHESVTSRGDVYAAAFFEAELPSQRPDHVESVRITIGNVDRQIVKAVREAIGRPEVTLEIILASDPDTVEAGPFEFALESVDYDELTVTGTLSFDDVTQHRYPSHTMTPWNFPDAF